MITRKKTNQHTNTQKKKNKHRLPSFSFSEIFFSYIYKRQIFVTNPCYNEDLYRRTSRQDAPANLIYNSIFVFQFEILFTNWYSSYFYFFYLFFLCVCASIFIYQVIFFFKEYIYMLGKKNVCGNVWTGLY